MSNLLSRSIIRGYGYNLGKNIAKPLSRGLSEAQKLSRKQRNSKTPLQKSLQFEPVGRLSTLIDRCYNMCVTFEDQLESRLNKDITSILISTYTFSYKPVMAKLDDCIQYLKFKETADCDLDHFEKLKEMVNEEFNEFIKSMVYVNFDYPEEAYNNKTHLLGLYVAAFGQDGDYLKLKTKLEEGKPKKKFFGLF